MPAPTDHACQLCQRETRLEFHHLIPRKVHRRPWFARRHSREEMHQRGIWICRLCHRFLHRRFDEVTLGRQFATLPDLLADPGVQRHIQWAGRQRPGKR